MTERLLCFWYEILGIPVRRIMLSLVKLIKIYILAIINLLLICLFV